jgi:hypothetical protein
VVKQKERINNMNKVKISGNVSWTVDVPRLIKILLRTKILRCNVKCGKSKVVKQKKEML